VFSDLYQVRMNGILLSQQCLNVFFVERTSTDYNAVDIALAVNANVWGTIRGVLSDSLTMTSIDVTSLANPADFATVPGVPDSGNVGGTSGQDLAPFLAAAIRFNRQRSDMRHGWMRFSGFREGQVTGELWSGAVTDALTTLGTLLMQDIMDETDSFSVCRLHIVKRIPYTTPSGKRGYRLPQDASEYVSYIPLTFDVYPRVTTQNSRKTGRGG
jgi:hypothetical protein